MCIRDRNDDAQVAFNLAMSTFPAKKSLADNEKILENPSLKVLAEHIDHYIWPGPMPATMETSLKKAGQDIFFNGVDIDTACLLYTSQSPETRLLKIQ